MHSITTGPWGLSNTATIAEELRVRQLSIEWHVTGVRELTRLNTALIY